MTADEWRDLVAQIADTYPRWPGLSAEQSGAWLGALVEGMRRRAWGVADLAAGVREHCISVIWPPQSPAELLGATERAVAAQHLEAERAAPRRAETERPRYSAEELAVRFGILIDIGARKLRASEVDTPARFAAETQRRLQLELRPEAAGR